MNESWKRRSYRNCFLGGLTKHCSSKFIALMIHYAMAYMYARLWCSGMFRRYRQRITTLMLHYIERLNSTDLHNISEPIFIICI